MQQLLADNELALTVVMCVVVVALAAAAVPCPHSFRLFLRALARRASIDSRPHPVEPSGALAGQVVGARSRSAGRPWSPDGIG
jgi:hypothetical protein